MELHKCKVYKCKIRMTTSKIYNVYVYYRIDIRCNGTLNQIYIRNFCERETKIPFSLLCDIHTRKMSFIPISFYIDKPDKVISDVVFDKIIFLYPDIFKLFESKDKGSLRIGIEILKQHLELNIQ